MREVREERPPRAAKRPDEGHFRIPTWQEVSFRRSSPSARPPAVPHGPDFADVDSERVRSDHPAVLLRTRTFAPSLFSSTFSRPQLSREVAPGQFVMLDVPERIRPYLRRAYSVADADPGAGEVEFLVKTIGPGTAALESLPAGQDVRLLGPLGNSFSLAGLPAGSRVAVVAGGIGAAPFPLLYRRSPGRALRETSSSGDGRLPTSRSRAVSRAS